MKRSRIVLTTERGGKLLYLWIARVELPER